MKVYVASSWRNPHQHQVVKALMRADFDVYDFRAPSEPGGTAGGFQWSEIDTDWKLWTPEEYRGALEHPLATHGLGRDLCGLETCDACVMVMPCGRSANLELGYMLGGGKVGVVYLPTDLEPKSWAQWFEPELMWGLAHRIAITLEEVLGFLRVHRARSGAGGTAR